jgi:hypothetical protein
MISLPDCKVTEGDGHLILSPERGDWHGILAYDKSVKTFLSCNPRYEVVKSHLAGLGINGEWDLVILKPPL